MRFPHLHNRLIGIACTLIIGCGVAIAMARTVRYSRSLRESGIHQARYLAATAVSAVNTQLLNVQFPANAPQAWNTLLKEHLSSHPAIAYMFIIRNNQVMGHTFPDGLPPWIQNANVVKLGQSEHFEFLESEGGENYLDFAVPVLKDHAAIFRVGLFEKALIPPISVFWVLPGLACGLVLILSLFLAFIMNRRLTRPLHMLVIEAEKMAQGNPAIALRQCKHHEINKLALSFSKMVEQLKSCSQNLTDRSAQVDRLHRQIFNAFEMIRTVGSHTTLQDVCCYLIAKMKDIMACQHLCMVTASKSRDYFFLCGEGQLKVIPAEQFETVWQLLAGIDRVTFIRRSSVSIPMLGSNFQKMYRLGMFPVQFENQKLGALFVGCPRDCRCDAQGLEIINQILQECAGAIKRAINHAEDLQRIQCKISTKSQYCGIVGKDRQMQTVFKLINDIAPTDAAALIQGESGTGKELVAGAIHEQSLRKDLPFVVINCSAYPASLLESELFGHEKGAFTGAIRKKIGRFELADGGTVFLDEIGEIAASAQIKLLRVLQTHAFERIGGEETLHVQVRIIAATNKDLLEEVRKGRFREDLYYRLNVIPIHLPPLRSRKNDIPLLARHFLDRFCSEQEKKVQDFSTEAMARLMEYEWPGNVRELENTIEHALVLTKNDLIEVAALPLNIRSANQTASNARPRMAVAENEKRLFLEILEESGWNKKLAAQRLGVSRSTLYNKIRKYRLKPPTLH